METQNHPNERNDKVGEYGGPDGDAVQAERSQRTETETDSKERLVQTGRSRILKSAADIDEGARQEPQGQTGRSIILKNSPSGQCQELKRLMRKKTRRRLKRGERCPRMTTIDEDEESEVDLAALMGTQNATEQTGVQGELGGPDGAAVQAKTVGMISGLETVWPEDGELGSIGVDGWEEVDFVVDSGASETVIGPHMVSSAEAKESRGSRLGVKYEVANGVRIDNLGEKKFVATSEENISSNITAQICEVNKGLLSVHKLVQKGNRVVFDQLRNGGSYIEHTKTGEKMHLVEKKGTFLLRIWTQPSSGKSF